MNVIRFRRRGKEFEISSMVLSVSPFAARGRWGWRRGKRKGEEKVETKGGIIEITSRECGRKKYNRRIINTRRVRKKDEGKKGLEDGRKIIK